MLPPKRPLPSGRRLMAPVSQPGASPPSPAPHLPTNAPMLASAFGGGARRPAPASPQLREQPGCTEQRWPEKQRPAEMAVPGPRSLPEPGEASQPPLVKNPLPGFENTAQRAEGSGSARLGGARWERGLAPERLALLRRLLLGTGCAARRPAPSHGRWLPGSALLPVLLLLLARHPSPGAGPPGRWQNRSHLHSAGTWNCSGIDFKISG